MNVSSRILSSLTPILAGKKMFFCRRSVLTIAACLGILVYAGNLVHADERFWSFEPPAEPPAVVLEDNGWASTPLDTLILAKLEEHQLRPAPPADRRTLLRRVTFGLTGLPPTPDEITEYLADDSPRALTKIVDRILASPHYGERWGRHWLDVARYADSNGLDENYAYANAWRYRDYVIAAWNSDKPYDQFVTEQLAGDLLPVSTDGSAHHERLIATGFLALGPKFLAEKDPQKMEMDIIDEQIDTFGRTLLGLTLGCARCHDHKFDPISTEDYYGLAGIFKSTRTMEHFIKFARWFENPLPTKQDQRRIEENTRRLVALEAEIQRDVENANRKILQDGKGLPHQEALYPAEVRERLRRNRREAAALRKVLENIPMALGATEREVVDVPVHRGGSHFAPGETIARRFPEVLAGDQQQPFDAHRSGRLRLARWLFAVDHPLSARVMVNRIWRWHFGEGLVRSPDNFGVQGDAPENQPLLDWLARRFVESGWSITAMHRLILLSQTYQMSDRYDADAARIDPENRLQWRWSVRRLEAEVIRDALLAMSGELDSAMGGSLMQTENRIHVFLYNQTDQTRYDFPRRSVYLPVIRNNLYDVFSLFDYADASVINGDRPTTTIAPQALFLLNSDFVHRATERMAGELLAEDLVHAPSQADTGRIGRLYLAAYSRPPTGSEVARAASFLNQAERDLATSVRALHSPRLGAWQLLCQVVVAADEFIYLR